MVRVIKNAIQKNFFIFPDLTEYNDIIYAKTNQAISLYNISLLSQLDYSRFESLQVSSSETDNIIIIAFSTVFESKSKLFIVDEFDECKDSYIIPKDTSKLFMCEPKSFGHFNYIMTFSSNKKYENYFI